MMIRFAVRNREGLWFRAKGYAGYGHSWTDDQEKAKLYGKLSQARARRTFFATTWPGHGVPDIVKFECEPTVLDDSAHFEKAKRRKATQRETSEVRRAKAQLKEFERQYEEAKQRLQGARVRAG